MAVVSQDRFHCINGYFSKRYNNVQRETYCQVQAVVMKFNVGHKKRA